MRCSWRSSSTRSVGTRVYDAPVRISAPIWILLWGVAMQPVAAQKGQQVGHALEFQQLGELLPDGTQVAVIQRSRGMKTKFEVANCRHSLSIRIPLPNLDSVDIQESKQDLPDEVPISILQRAHTKFQVLLRDG